MKINFLKYKYFFAYVFVALIPISACATMEVVYHDDFSGSQEQQLHGTLPDTDLVGGNTWISHSSWKADGGTGLYSVATLPFVPQSGYVYSLTATLREVTGDNYWIGFGYTAGSSKDYGQRFLGTPTTGHPWLLRRGNSASLPDVLFPGPGTNYSVDITETLDRSLDVTFRIILDTRNANWQVQWLQKIADTAEYTPIYFYEYGENPSIRAVGFAAGQTSISARIDELVLEQSQSSLQVIQEGQPDDIFVYREQNAEFEVAFTSNSLPSVVWHKIQDGQDVIIESGQAGTSMTLDYDSQTGLYRAVLTIYLCDLSDEGSYYAVLDNDDNLAIQTRMVWLHVKAIVSYWPLGKDDFSEGFYNDIEGHNDAAVTGTPQFVAGYDQQNQTAALIKAESGWATTESFAMVSGTGAFSICLRCQWQESGDPQNLSGDLQVDSLWNGTSRIESGIKPVGQWKMICLTFDGNIGRIYLDDRLISSEIWPNIEVGDISLDIGHNGGGEIFNGGLDDIRIYNYALSEIQVGSLYSGTGDCSRPYAQEFDYSGPNGVADCIVDLYDLTVLMGNWLSCGLYPDCQ